MSIFENEAGQRTAAKLLPRDETRREVNDPIIVVYGAETPIPRHYAIILLP